MFIKAGLDICALGTSQSRCLLSGLQVAMEAAALTSLHLTLTICLCSYDSSCCEVNKYIKTSAEGA